MSKRLSVAVQGWTSYRARVLCGPSAMPSPHTTCHPHGTLTTAILAKTENEDGKSGDPADTAASGAGSASLSRAYRKVSETSTSFQQLPGTYPS